MSSRIHSDLLRIDGALRSCPSRASLKSGSIDAWTACDISLEALLAVLPGSVFIDQGGSAAAVSMHWRKSSASKKLLALLQAVIEEAHVVRYEAAGPLQVHTVHGSICVISFFWQCTRRSGPPCASGSLSWTASQASGKHSHGWS